MVDVLSTESRGTQIPAAPTPPSAAERELALVYTLDQLRDSSRDEDDFLDGCVAALTQAIGARLCMVLMRDEAGEFEPRVSYSATGYIDDATETEAITLTRDAIAQGEPLVHLAADGYMLAWPIRWPTRGARAPLGALLVGRREQFTSEDSALLRAAASQTDTTLEHFRLIEALRLRERELEIIYKVDHIRDTIPEFPLALERILGVLTPVIGADIGFIMLYDRVERRLRLAASTENDLLETDPVGQVLMDLASQTRASGELTRREGIHAAISSYIGVPLELDGQIIGVFGGANRVGQAPFNRDALVLLKAVATQIDTAVFANRRQAWIREVFSRFVNPKVVDIMLRDPDADYMAAIRTDLTVLFSDMRGFTTVAEQMDPQELARMLNTHLDGMTKTLLDFDGTVDKFVGDEVMALFGAPLAMSDHALSAVRAALAMRAAQDAIAGRWVADGLPGVRIGIGISSGEAVVGNVGSALMTNYTAVGPTINLGARLCSVAGPNQILLSATTYERIKEWVVAEPLPPMPLRHIAQPVQAYNLIGLREGVEL